MTVITSQKEFLTKTYPVVDGVVFYEDPLDQEERFLDDNKWTLRWKSCGCATEIIEVCAWEYEKEFGVGLFMQGLDIEILVPTFEEAQQILHEMEIVMVDPELTYNN